MTSSISKLQMTVTKLEKKIIELEDRVEFYKEKEKQSKKSLKYYKNSIENMIEKAVTKAVGEVTEKYEAIIKEKDQRIFELETRLNINSDNSSLPSSQTPIYQSKICNSRKPTGDKPGRKEGHPKAKLAAFNEDEITERVEHKKNNCSNCGSDKLKLIKTRTRDELDIKKSVIKRRHYFYDYKCEECGNVITSEIPLELHGENQYGTEIKTLISTLSNYGFVSYNRIRKIICGLTNGEINPSEGYMNKLQKKISSRLSDFVFDVKEKILKSKLVYWDDTVVAIGDKDKACMRVYTNELYVLYKAHIAKDTAGMDEDGILQNLPSDTTVMHDHLLHNYCDEYRYKNIECNAHITRKLEGITQNTSHNWSSLMKNLIEEMLKLKKEHIENKIYSFKEDEINIYLKKYDEILEAGFKEYVEFKHKYEFEKEENLLEFMRDFKEPITAWVYDYNLPYSNNLSESLLRMLKAKMKISYRFKDLSYAESFANIRTYTETCSRFGLNVCDAMRKLFEGKPYTVDYLEKLELDNTKTADTNQ